MKKRTYRFKILRSIFTAPLYILLTITIVILYYALFQYVITASNLGLFLVTAPIYLVYLLILSSSILLTTSIYAACKAIHAKYASMEGGALSILTSSIGTLIVGCNCYAPILSSILYTIGFGTLAVGSVLSFISIYQVWIVVAFIAINLIFIYYQLGRITRIGGAATRK